MSTSEGSTRESCGTCENVRFRTSISAAVSPFSRVAIMTLCVRCVVKASLLGGGSVLQRKWQAIILSHAHLCDRFACKIFSRVSS